MLAFSAAGVAQTTDLARIEYLTIPISKSNSIKRYRALIQAPIPISKEEKSFLVVGLEYRFVDITIGEAEDVSVFNAPLVGTSEVTNNMVNAVQRMDAYLGYTWKISPDWRLGIKGGLTVQSNLENSLVSDDIIYEGAVYAIKDNKRDTLAKQTRLILGLTYSTTPGRNFPLPLINYNKEFHRNWTYTLGVPKTNIRHYINESHKDAFQAFGTLDNFFGNIQQNFVVGNKVAENISMTTVVFGLGYEHFFTDHLLLYVYGAHSVYSDFRLRNGDGEEVYTINEDTSFYLRTGLKFKF